MPAELTTPVAFLIFNRPEVTARVFAEIARARPRTLLVIADGPRDDRPDDADRCREARAILDRVDWDCNILRNFSDRNMGCRQRVATGLTWAFETVPEAIVLEDDCLPHPTFFPFCRDLLERHRDDERMMMVSGFNPLGRWKASEQTHHFTYLGTIWGWASWSRAWRHYDVNIPKWSDPAARRIVRDRFCVRAQYRQRAKLFDRVQAGEIDTWDFQWTFTRLLHGGLSAVSAVNLISNIGFGEDATHTRSEESAWANTPREAASFPLTELADVKEDRAYVREVYRRFQRAPSSPWKRVRRILGGLKRRLANLVRRKAEGT
jgi:hypothetical protein